jgi:hypothetical protein
MSAWKPRVRQKPFPVKRYKFSFILLATVALAAFSKYAVLAHAQDRKTTPNPSEAIASGGEYVGSRACASCHKRIYEDFSRTGMGRSMTRVTPGLLKTLPTKASLHDQHQNLEVFQRDGKLYQSEFENDDEGKEIFRDTHEVEWIIGSGANGFAGIIRRGAYLFQAPLSFYRKPQSWALSPGYESGNYGFNRPILPGCIFCHSGQPRPVTNGNGRFENPAFLEMAIGCENCHGPGITHVLEMQEGQGSYRGNDPSIVNPARLSTALSDNICMSCHQAGDARVLKPGKDYGDFRPGTALENTLSIFMIPPKRESPPQSDLLEHYYSMTLSKCYQKSSGRLGCTTCHDPHFEPSHEEAPAYFRKKCLTCHTEKSCSLSLEVRRLKNSPDDCSGCHMLKRDVQVVSHSSLTNHRILRKPDEPFPDVAFRQTTEALPDLIHLNPVPGHEDVPLPRLTLLQAYGELMDKKHEYLGRYLRLLDELEQTEPHNGLVEAALGRRALRQGKFEKAVTHLEQALEAGTPQAMTYADLAEALVKLDRAGEAMSPLEKAIALDPFNPTLQKTMVLRLIQLKRYEDAKAAMERYIENFPEDSFMRQMLARAKSRGSLK